MAIDMNDFVGKNGYAMREADTEYGRVRGLASGNPHITSFKGIPYAAPPVGELRWKAPQPPKPWKGVKECYKFSATPIQFRAFGGRDNKHSAQGSPDQILGPGSEDCLYLNIWTPAKTPDEKLPVLFWIYGGAFVGGAANNGGRYDGEGFAKRGVVFVSFNYRAGPLGLFAHPELSAETGHGSGNYYFLDQIAALKWCRRNIQNFGGDPDKITIFGHSSGSAAAAALSCTPLTRGDIVGASIQSSAIARDFDGPSELFAPLEECEKRGVEYMELCGCKNIREMRQVSVDVLQEAFTRTKRGMFTFCGAIDGYIFPDNPSHMFYRGEHHDIAYIAGAAMDEESQLGKHFNFSNMLTRERVPDYAKNFEAKEKDFIDFCSKLSDAELVTGLLHSCSMRNRQLAVNQLRFGRKPAYLYVFSRRLPGDNAGSPHGAELQYLFQTLKRDWRPYSAGDYELSDIMTDYWANFAKTGSPNGEGLPEWTPFTYERPHTLMLDVRPYMCEYRLSKVQLYKIDYFTSTDVVHSMI